MFFELKKKKNSHIRKFPFLPRLGIYIDVAGYEFIFKQVSLLEAMANLPERGFLASQVKKIIKEQLEEVHFPKKEKSKVVNTTARSLP